MVETELLKLPLALLRVILCAHKQPSVNYSDKLLTFTMVKLHDRDALFAIHAYLLVVIHLVQVHNT